MEMVSLNPAYSLGYDASHALDYDEQLLRSETELANNSMIVSNCFQSSSDVFEDDVMQDTFDWNDTNCDMNFIEGTVIEDSSLAVDWPSGFTPDITHSSIALHVPEYTPDHEVGHTVDPNYNREDDASLFFEVCLGAICDVQVRPFESNTRLQALNGPCKTLQDCYEVVPRGQGFVMRTTSGDDVAVINKKVSQGLHAAMDVHSTRAKAFRPLANNANTERGYPGLDRAALTTVEINIYSLRQGAKRVGRCLCSNGIFLQRPIYGVQEAPYENPQTLKLPDSINDVLDGISQDMDLGHVVGDGDLDIAFVFDHLPDQHQDVDIEIDSRVLSPLESWQKSGVAFISQRESARWLEPRSLWKKDVQDSDSAAYAFPSVPAIRFQSDCEYTSMFRHAIVTSKISARPHEVRGGILADEMGLGKTIMMLATIVATLEPASCFASKQHKGNNDGVVSRKFQTGATLIVVPSVLILDSWMYQIKKHLAPRTINVHKYHGTGKEIDLRALSKFDVVITTYHTIEHDLDRGHRFFTTVHWYRAVLDEAHMIRTESTKQFQALSEIVAEIKWCLTGTPIQNGLEDLAALMKFLRVPLLENSSTFRESIIHPIDPKRASGYANLRILLESICLRRTRELLGVPEPSRNDVVLDFSPDEKYIYNAIKQSYKERIEKAVLDGDVGDARNAMLELLWKRRVVCNFGTFAVSQNNNPLSASSFHGDRIEMIVKNVRTKQQRGQKQQLLSDMADADRSSSRSTKLEELTRDVQAHADSDKSLVFSFWQSTLEVVQFLFSRNNIGYSRIDGSMSPPSRRESLRKFQKDPSTVALLITLGTGAEGIDITSASRIYILEPQWNPAVEKQAIGRAVRFGQEKEVTISRYFLRGSIEQYVQSIQSKKLQLAGGGFGDINLLNGEEIKQMLNLFVLDIPD
ncbi:MAG: hypothetical protein M1820_003070 [Bogoriella megaspora]|nr:MAG: hypothetical protein M1820_003070 [Bogoriella megaspora]